MPVKNLSKPFTCPLCRQRKPDLIIIDPLIAYGGLPSENDNAAMSAGGSRWHGRLNSKNITTSYKTALSAGLAKKACLNSLSFSKRSRRTFINGLIVS